MSRPVATRVTPQSLAALALTSVGLAPQVKSTGRKDFIREGKDVGEVVVIITNEGIDSFKHDVYGDSIKITRTLRKSGSAWKTSPGNSEKTVKSTAAEVRAISDHYNFQASPSHTGMIFIYPL